MRTVRCDSSEAGWGLIVGSVAFARSGSRTARRSRFGAGASTLCSRFPGINEVNCRSSSATASTHGLVPCAISTLGVSSQSTASPAGHAFFNNVLIVCFLSLSLGSVDDDLAAARALRHPLAHPCLQLRLDPAHVPRSQRNRLGEPSLGPPPVDRRPRQARSVLNVRQS